MKKNIVEALETLIDSGAVLVVTQDGNEVALPLAHAEVSGENLLVSIPWPESEFDVHFLRPSSVVLRYDTIRIELDEERTARIEPLRACIYFDDGEADLLEASIKRFRDLVRTKDGERYRDLFRHVLETFERERSNVDLPQ